MSADSAGSDDNLCTDLHFRLCVASPWLNEVYVFMHLYY